MIVLSGSYEELLSKSDKDEQIKHIKKKNLQCMKKYPQIQSHYKKLRNIKSKNIKERH